MGKIIKNHSFSLIELLAAMAIAAILIGIAVPAFNTLTKGQSVEAAARIVGSQLKATRTYAISNREYTALIIPTTESLSSDYLYKAYRPCIVDSSSVFQQWISGEKWEFLPAGSAILDIDNTSGYNAGNFTSASTITSVDFSAIGGGSSESAKGIVFTPSGKAGTRKYVVIGSSVVADGEVGSTGNQINVTVDQYSGRISYGSN